jgi:hypothetical protein
MFHAQVLAFVSRESLRVALKAIVFNRKGHFDPFPVFFCVFMFGVNSMELHW